MDTFLELLRLVAVGIISGLFSAYIANRGHRNKKWWELRVASYKEVIEALSDLNHYFNQSYKAEIEHREFSDAYKLNLQKVWNDSYNKVRRAADSGVFLFSDDVNRALNEFANVKDEDHDTYFDYLDSNLVVAEKCLKSVVALAKKDLQVEGRWF